MNQNNTQIMDEKPDIAANSLYPIFADATLNDLHEAEMSLLQSHILKNNQPRNIALIGPGSEVLPFSNNPEVVKNITNGGNLILLDYNPNILGKAAVHLQTMGFSDNFDIEPYNPNTNLESIAGKILLGHHDIRKPLPFIDHSLDAIDMTLSVHHATQYLNDIARIGKNMSLALTQNGILHVGEGNVDMKGTEYKIKEIYSTLQDLGYDSTIVDKRSPDQTYKIGNGNLKVNINEEGLVSIKNNEDIVQKLLETMYDDLIPDDVECWNANQEFPLIVQYSQRDRKHINEVNTYYNAIRKQGLDNIDEQYIKPFESALKKESRDARKGIIEFYTHPKDFSYELTRSGLTVVHNHQTPIGPFNNIIAINR